jgi:hypothetical protein
MAKILSTAQKTFVDLYDSYVLNMSSDVVAVPCDQYGKSIDDYKTTITFNVKRGTKVVGCTCELIDGGPDGIYSIGKYASTTSQDGRITIWVRPKANFADDLTVGFKFTTTDDNEFVFERYITFIKIKSGEKIVTFQIHSKNGDVFKEGVEEITMETIAFDGLAQITNATYSWSYYDSANGKWINVSEDQSTQNSIGSSLTISRTVRYANSVFRCIMKYNGQTYEDYFTLKIFNHSYDAVIKFFDGSNIFDASEPFIVAYIELYKDQQEEELLKATYYYYHEGNTYNVDTGKYTFNSTNLDEGYKINGTLVYMIYKVVNSKDKCAKYKVRLCQYNNGWASVNATTYGNKYVYKNDLYDDLYEDIATNIVVISKEDVSKCKDVNFTVYTKAVDSDGDYVCNNDLIIARANVTVIDLNDPVISATKPSNPQDGQLWLNTSTSPYTLYIYENEKWVYFTQQNGKTVYTTKPTSYSKGDLWILAPREVCGGFSEGTMLRAKQSSSTFSDSHWEDAMSTLTTMYNNIAQTFTFNPNNEKGKLPGLTIGQTDEAFYVNINSQKMSFYDNSERQNKEVVYISNESANIDGLVVETSLDVNCNATFNEQVRFGNFVWKTEGNGSLSLAIYN